MAAEKGHCANCAPFYHYSLSIAVLKITNKYKSSKFQENGEIEFNVVSKFCFDTLLIFKNYIHCRLRVFPTERFLTPPPINFVHDEVSKLVLIYYYLGLIDRRGGGSKNRSLGIYADLFSLSMFELTFCFESDMVKLVIFL